MPEDAGKLEVEYVVISDTAVRRLEKLQAEMDKVEKTAEKQGKTMQASFKQAGIAMAAFGAVAVGVLYSIIKSSSYASIWFDQLKYSVMRIADELLEMTGLREDIDNFFKSLESLIDIWTDEDLEFTIKLEKTWGVLYEFWDDLSTTKKIILLIGAAAALVIIGLTGLWLVVAWGGAVLGTLGTVLGATILGVSVLTIAFFAAGVILGIFLGLIGVWIMSKTGISKWFEDLGEGFRDWDHWIHDILNVTVGLFALMGAAINGLVTGDFYQLRKGIHEIKESFKSLSALIKGEKYIKKIFGEDDKAHDPRKYFDELAAGIIDSEPDIERAWDIIRDNEIGWHEQRKMDAYNAVIDNYKTQSETMMNAQPLLDNAASESGKGILDNFTEQTDQIPIGLEDSLKISAENAGLGTEWINDEMLALITDYMINVGVSFNGGPMGGAGWDAPYAGGPVVPGWKQIGAEEPTAPGQPDIYSATGAHVLRTGAAVIHQGEDIVNLKALMSGARMDKTGMGGKDIVINNNITINSGDLRNPSEIRRAANTISKQMGEELRRISTSI